MLVHVTCTKDFKWSENLINPYFSLSFIFHSLKPKKYIELPISACHLRSYTAPVILNYRTDTPYNQKLLNLSQLLTAAGSQRKKKSIEESSSIVEFPTVLLSRLVFLIQNLEVPSLWILKLDLTISSYTCYIDLLSNPTLAEK